MNKFPLFKNKKDGYTLVEALVAIVILSLGLIPSLITIILGNSFTSAIKNNLIATNLAQEAVEVVRAIRDTNWFNGLSFDNGLVAPSFDCSVGCRVEWNSTSLLAEAGNPNLYINNGLYSYTGTTPSLFKRRMIIVKDPTSPGCNCELGILVEVSWPEKNRTKTIFVESHLYNWR